MEVNWIEDVEFPNDQLSALEVKPIGGKEKKGERTEEDWWNVFSGADWHGDLMLNLDEFAEGYRKEDPNVTQADIEGAFKKSDTDGDGQLSWGEFAVFVGLEAPEKDYNKEDLEKIFYGGDWHGDGLLDYEEFAAAYRNEEPGVKEEEIKSAFENGDNNKDGKLEWDEFLCLVTECRKKGGKEHEEWTFD